MGEAPATSVSRSYRIVRLLARWMLRSQYRRIEIDGAERVPREGAAMFVANHFSSIVDSMAILHASPRPISFLAKAPLWKSRVLAFILDAVGAVPVYRPQDAAENEGRSTRANLATFRACRERLEAGGAIALFPEGVSQPRPRLMPVRTGAARIALDTKAPVAVCPVGVVLEPAVPGRRGTLLVCFGEPLVVDGWTGFPSRRAAITTITRWIEGALRDLLAETESQADMVALSTLRVVWDQERNVRRPRTLAGRHRRHRLFARGLARLQASAPEDVDALRAETDAYVRALDLAGIRPDQLGGRYTAGRVARFLLLRVPPLLVAAPLAFVAAVVTWPVRRIGDLIALRRFGGREDVRALCRMGGGAFLLLVGMVVGGLLAGILWSPWAGLAVFFGLPVLLAFHVAWRERSQAARASVHSFLLLAGARLRETLQRHRHQLYEHLSRMREHLRDADAPRAGTP